MALKSLESDLITRNIGGYEHAGIQQHALSTNAKYENDVWSKFNAKLSSNRHGHSAIWLEDEIFVIGGHAAR